MARRDVLRHYGRYIYRREDFQAICDGDDCAAQILDLMEFWTGCKFDEIKRVQNYNKQAEKFGQPLQQEPSFWLYERVEDFQSGLMDGYKRSYILQRLKTLKAKGFIQDKPSPNCYDKTKMYLLNVKAVQSALDAWWQQCQKKAETLENAIVPVCRDDSISSTRESETLVNLESSKITLQDSKTNLESSKTIFKSPKVDFDLYDLNSHINNQKENSLEEPKPPSPVSGIPHPISLSQDAIAGEGSQRVSVSLKDQPTPNTSDTPTSKKQDLGVELQIQSGANTCAGAAILPTGKKEIIPDRENSALRSEQKFLERASGVPEYRTKRGANGIKPEFVEVIAKYLSSTPHYLERAVAADAIAAKRYIINQEEKGNQDLLIEQYRKHCAIATQKEQEGIETVVEQPKYQGTQESLISLFKAKGNSIMSRWTGFSATGRTQVEDSQKVGN